MKKLLSTILVLALMLSLSVAAFAAGTASITVADPGDYTYVAYKIFDVADDGNGNLTYTLPKEIGGSANPWLAVLVDDSKDSKSVFDGLTLTDGTDAYTVTKGNTFSAAKFAEFLKAGIPAGASAIDFAGAKAENLDAGYYLVISKSGETVQDKAALTTVLDGKNVTIQNKNDMPFDKTVENVKEKSVQVGDTLNFKIEGKVPSVDDGDTFYVYLVSDKMDEGLTFNKTSFTVTIDGATVTLTEITDSSAILDGDQVRYNANGKTFELSLDMLSRGKTGSTPALAGKDIVISYTATVNKDAVAVVSENKAVLEYGNNPSELTVKDSETKTYTAQIVIDKFETGAPEQKLSGAKFVLKNSAEKFYSVDANGVVTWVDAQADATEIITDTNGAASFKGLEDGTYYLVETEAPAGYAELTEAIAISVKGSAATAVGLSDGQIAQILTNVANVSNTPGTVLPSTGGMGTTIFYVLGVLLFVGAAVLIVTGKRKTN